MNRDCCVPVLLCAAAAAWLLPSSPTRAHDGRRFIIEVVEGKLRAQGVNSGASDGAPAIRGYANSIHDHWLNVTPLPESGLGPFASSFLPDFEAPLDVAFTLLKDHRLELELSKALQWKDPPPMPTAGTIPMLTTLDPGVVIQVESTGGVTTSSEMGSVLLSNSVPSGGIEDIVMNYQVNGHPSGTIHVLEFVMSATPNDPAALDVIADSDPIYVILSPDGPDKLTRQHHASLYLEEYLALHPIRAPEPSSAVLLTLPLWLASRRRSPRANPTR